MILAEHDEIANQLIDPKVGSSLINMGSSGMLLELHITDQKTYNTMPLMLRAVLRVPIGENNKEEDEQFHQLFQMAIYMVDLVAGVRLSPTVSAKCEKSRKKQKQAEASIKKEALEESKMEARRETDRLERERVKRMTPAEQAKYEDKKAKKETQKMKSKHMKIMK